ncbi:MAG: hypothetical protein IKE42_08980 [Aquamicrobium sp.]|jgi:uncharacterized membrane protein YeiB|nr:MULTISPECIES: hypothetical protein [Mesorhizobium]MBR2687974.1 hypothetical protein [Aquamicrobium sp.]
MLARRFTIVCLLTALFGMGFAILVAENARLDHGWNQAGLRCGTTCSSSF